MFLEILYLKRGHGIEIHSPILHKSPVDRISCNQAGARFSPGKAIKFWQSEDIDIFGTENHQQQAGLANAIATWGYRRYAVIFLDPNCKMVWAELFCN
jgi:hypothetical protein